MRSSSNRSQPVDRLTASDSGLRALQRSAQNRDSFGGHRPPLCLRPLPQPQVDFRRKVAHVKLSHGANVVPHRYQPERTSLPGPAGLL